MVNGTHKMGQLNNSQNQNKKIERELFELSGSTNHLHMHKVKRKDRVEYKIHMSTGCQSLKIKKKKKNNQMNHTKYDHS